MEMWHKRKDGTIVEFLIVTNPPEALYWSPSSYKLKLTDVRIITKMPKKEMQIVRKEIFDDIVEKESKPHPNTVSKERKTTKRDNAKARRKQQEAG